MKSFKFSVLAIAALLFATTGPATAGDLFLHGVDFLMVKNAGGCKKMDPSNVRCSIKHGQYTYVYFEAKRPKYEQCAVSVARGPGERWHVDASPCVAKRNGPEHVYISVPK